jgi:hypothetical protein
MNYTGIIEWFYSVGERYVSVETAGDPNSGTENSTRSEKGEMS